MKTKYWICVIGVILTCTIIFIVFYPLRFDLYECQKAKKIVDYILIPLFGFGLVYFIFINVKKDKGTFKDFFVYLPFVTGLVIMAYLSMFRPFFGNVLTLFNSCIGNQETKVISGVITNKIVISGWSRGIGKYKLIIDSKEDKYLLDSNLMTINKFEVNDTVDIKMKKGILGLLYLDK